MAVASPGAEPLLPRGATAVITRSERRRHRLPVGIAGLVLVLGGAVLQLVAFVAEPWLDGSDKNPTGIRLGFTGFGGRTQRGFAHIYFGWGAWLLFALMLFVGVTACIRWRAARAFRIAGGLLGVVGAGASIVGVLVFAYQTDAEVFHIARNYGVGAYLATLGFLAGACGAAAGEVGT